MKSETKAAFRAAFPHTIPILTGFLMLGFSYGVYMRSLGFSAVYPMVMCLAVFAGSLEFLAGSILLSPFDPLAAFLLGFAVNARHIFYSISMLEKYDRPGLKKTYMIYALCDETFSVNISAEPPEGIDKMDFMFAVTLLNQLYWVAGSWAGALIGSAIPFDTTGLDFVMTALFIVIFLDHFMSKKPLFSSASGFVLSVLSLIIFGPDKFLIPAMVSFVAALLLARRRYDNT